MSLTTFVFLSKVLLRQDAGRFMLGTYLVLTSRLGGRFGVAVELWRSGQLNRCSEVVSEFCHPKIYTSRSGRWKLRNLIWYKIFECLLTGRYAELTFFCFDTFPPVAGPCERWLYLKFVSLAQVWNMLCLRLVVKCGIASFRTLNFSTKCPFSKKTMSPRQLSFFSRFVTNFGCSHLKTLYLPRRRSRQGTSPWLSR